jgi:negative regulator of replication initiation
MDNTNENTIPENFQTVILDFTKDLSITFPEYTYLWAKYVNTNLPEEELIELYNYCLSVYPERFFDILYQTDDIFKPDATTNTLFLPNVEFKLLFNCEGVSENTKKSIWKYLQLVLFTVIGGVKDKTKFGDTMNMFEGMNEEELQGKLKEAMEGITDFFKHMESDEQGEHSEAKPDFDKIFENMPNADQFPNSEEFKKAFENMSSGIPTGMPDISNMQDHLKTIFEGKIGTLAKEMAEEISEEFSDILGADTGDIQSTDDLMKKLMKNPKKIMDLMKTVSGKLDKKMASGDISKDEIMKEASDLVNKMKEMGGTEQFNELFKNLTKSMGAMGKGARMDTNAMERMTKQQTTRERMLRKLEQRKQLQNQMKPNVNYSIQQGQQPGNYVFSLPDSGVQERTPINSQAIMDQLIAEEENTKAKAPPKKTNKKKKGKK